MSKIRYVVREDRAVVPNPDNPDDFDRVPCWNITRETDGSMGWHIGKYRTKEAAEFIAEELRGFIAQEIDG